MRTTPVQQRSFDATVATVNRVAMRIVALPREHREEAFQIARRNYEAALRKFGQDNKPIARQWLDLVDNMIRQRVSDIEASGGAGGGRA
jgi:hypothetical protein